MQIYYDSLQEGVWFQRLNPSLNDAELLPFPTSSQTSPNAMLLNVLSYDRPDIVLTDEYEPILVVERTVEVPSGHNVGQRFARLVAAAQSKVPVVYFGPFVAYKHGGKTQGPRYMNLRLFNALNKLAEIESSTVTILNWPVDDNFEIIQQSSVRDVDIKEYLNLFFRYYLKNRCLQEVHEALQNSSLENRLKIDRDVFINEKVVNADQYESPPDSVRILNSREAKQLINCNDNFLDLRDIVVYKIGMNYIRSDPYTGMAMLYSYLYCGGLTNRDRVLVLHFPNISKQEWFQTSQNRKDIKLYKLACDGILFNDGFLSKNELNANNNQLSIF